MLRGGGEKVRHSWRQAACAPEAQRSCRITKEDPETGVRCAQLTHPTKVPRFFRTRRSGGGEAALRGQSGIAYAQPPRLTSIRSPTMFPKLKPISEQVIV